MQNFLTKSTPSPLAVVMVAGLGYFVLMPAPGSAARPTASEIACQSAGCLVCRLPLYGSRAVASKLGPDSSASADAAHQGTIRK